MLIIKINNFNKKIRSCKKIYKFANYQLIYKMMKIYKIN